MKTNDVLHKHEQKFRRSRTLVKVSLAMLVLLMLLLQYHHIVNWLKGGARFTTEATEYLWCPENILT